MLDSSNQNLNSVKTVPWGPYHIMVCLGMAYLVIPLLIKSCLNLWNPWLSPANVLWISQSVSYLCWIGIFIGLGWYYHRSPQEFLGLQIQRPIKTFLLNLGLGIGGTVGIIAFVTLSSGLFSIHHDNPYQHLPAEQWQVIRFFAVLAPIIEELVFRGLIHSTLIQKYSPLKTILLSALIFTLFHQAYSHIPIALLYVALLGVFYGYLRLRSGSIYSGMAGHLFNNLLATLILS